ncbi:MAG: glycosyltransferase, partial [Gemmataceae bacterium]
LIVPTRRRVPSLARFLDSLRATAADPASYEVILVTDDDDADTAAFPHPRRAVGPPRRTMGELNLAGLAAARGDFVMLLNDDVIARTPGWDRVLLHHARRFADGVVLVHADDGLMRHHLCVFPLLSRRYLDRVGLCDPRYRRYRIDDHVEDVFLRLAALGERRIVYLPGVLFEHLNAVEVNGRREYHAPPDLLGPDAALFDALAPDRQRAAAMLYESIVLDRLRRRLDAVRHPARYDRTPGVCVLPAAGPAALNQLIAAAEHDFIAVGTAPAEWLVPREEAVLHRPGALYLDRARVGHAPFDERYRGYLFDIDLALHHGAAFAPGPQPFGPPLSADDYAHDLALFRERHAADPGVPRLAPAPSLLTRAMRCWRERGLAGVVTAALAAIGRPAPPAAASGRRSSPP